MIFNTESEAETESVAQRFASELQPFDVVALRGGMGVGKTAFTRGLARGLGVTSRVTSPTFTIVNEYDGVIPVFHFDMFRLSDSGELYDIGWDDYLARGGVSVVEWSERVEDALPENHVSVDIAADVSRQSRRTITIERSAN